jgi:hypothetical protein
MKKIMKFTLLAFTVIISCPALAQTHADQGDEIKTIVISEFQPEITKNIRKIIESPSIRDTAVPAPDINYQLPSRKLDTYFPVEAIKPAKMVGEPLNKLYHTYLKGGFGIPYMSLYGEGWYNSGRSKDGSFSVHARHFSSSSSVGGTPGFSGFSDDDINLSGKKFIGKHTVDGALDYSHNSLFYYGDDVGSYPHSKDSIHQNFNYVGANVGLLSHYTDSFKINHSVRLSYYYLEDHHKTSENNVRLNGNMSRYLHTELLGLDILADYYHNNSLKDTSNATLLKIHPNISANGEKWQLRAGLSSWTEFGKGQTFFSFLPDAEASYDIFKHIITPYVGISGDVVRNSYKRLSDENPFVSPAVTVDMKNTRYKYMLFGGLRGSLSSYTSYDAQITYGKVENAAFFVNDTTDPQRNKYTVVYDDGTLLKIHGEVGYQKTEKFRLLVKGDYVKYFLDHQIQAWHTPTTRITLSAYYNLKQKISVKADLFALNEQYALTYLPNAAKPSTKLVKSKELGGLVDVNLGLEYRYTKFLSAFLNFNNIGAVRYQRWNDYPTQRFNLLAGVALIF